jgi:hypothetical protein
VKTLAGEVVETVYEADGDKELKAVRETVFREGELSYIEGGGRGESGGPPCVLSCGCGGSGVS